MDMRFGTWNVMSLYRTVLLKTVANKLAKCNLDLVVVCNVSWDNSGSEPGRLLYIFLWKWEY
jgi:hypothetical protein